MLPMSYHGDSIDLYINSTCNLKCRTCFLGNEYFKTTRNMSLETIESILRWARAAGVQDVALLGGEPSLHPDIVQILSLPRTIGIPANRFVTNGSRPFQRLLGSPAADLIDVSYVSLDGATAYTNDRVRGGGTFSQACGSMKILRERQMPFVITCSITPGSYEELGQLIQLAEESGCRLLNIHWVSPTGRARDGQESVDPEAWLALCDRVARYVPMRSDLSIQCQAAYLVADSTSNPKSALDDKACAVRDRTNLQFMPDGSVYACGLLVDQPSLNGYVWNGQSIIATTTPNELSICSSDTGRGCPVRKDVVPDLLPRVEHYVPLCIYQRIHNASD